MYYVFVWLPVAKEWNCVDREYPTLKDAASAVARLAVNDLDAYIIGW